MQIKQMLYVLSNQTQSGVPYVFNLRRFEVIALKYLREGKNFSSIAQKLMQDDYFKLVQQKFGKAMAIKLASHIIEKAMDKERETIRREPQFT